MKTLRYLVVSAMVGVALLFGIQSTSHALTLGFNDFVNPIFFVTDNQPGPGGDINPLIGVITFAGGFLGYIFQSEAALAVALGGALNPFLAVPVSLGVASAVVGAYYGHKIASGEGIFDLPNFKKLRKWVIK